eukprot:3466641-Prymnesium_polylepis.3
MRYVRDSFEILSESTIGSSFLQKKILIQGTDFHLRLFDTAGQERFRRLTAFYLQGSKGVVIVFDLTDRESFDEIEGYWLPKVKEVSPEAQIMLLANKADLASEKRAVSTDEARCFAEKWSMIFME